MSFKKKNVVLNRPGGGAPAAGERVVPQSHVLLSGTRPSPLDGRLTTSTGTQSLDQYLAGHAGFPVGTSLLIEETGTTDFSGVLLKYYASEGLVQGQHVHVLGLGKSWRDELPGLSKNGSASSRTNSADSEQKMKIAWRYETFGSRGGDAKGSDRAMADFCHQFDLSARLDSTHAKGQFHPYALISSTGRSTAGEAPASPLQTFIIRLAEKLRDAPSGSLHRVIVPSLLSPTLYDPTLCRPSAVLPFLHGLRALLRQYAGQLSVMISLPTSLFPRSTGFTRWMEILCDGVIEMVPLPRPVHAQPTQKSDDVTQGMLNVHRLPIYNERGGGIGGKACQENLSFKLSASSGLVIKPFSLPPVGETEPEKEKETKAKEAGLSF